MRRKAIGYLVVAALLIAMLTLRNHDASAAEIRDFHDRLFKTDQVELNELGQRLDDEARKTIEHAINRQFPEKPTHIGVLSEVDTHRNSARHAVVVVSSGEKVCLLHHIPGGGAAATCRTISDAAEHGLVLARRSPNEPTAVVSAIAPIAANNISLGTKIKQKFEFHSGTAVVELPYAQVAELTWETESGSLIPLGVDIPEDAEISGD